MRRILNEIGFISHAIKCDSGHVVKCYDAWCEFRDQEDYQLFLDITSECGRKAEIANSVAWYDGVDKEKMKSSPVLNNSNNIYKIPHNNLKPFKVYFFMLFELCRNTLDDYMFSKMPFKQSLECIKTIADGLAIIHQQNIIHRDIKPSNLFIATDNKPKIGDFGLSVMKKCPHLEEEKILIKSVSETSKESDDIQSFLSSPIARTSRAFSDSCACDDKYDEAGSLPYLAPEQINHLRIDSSVDIYSLGIVLYLMVIEFSTAHEKSILIRNLKSGKVDEVLNVRYPFLCELILRMTNTCSDKRPNAIEVSEKLAIVSKAI
jgi:serine/threonine protein kinase